MFDYMPGFRRLMDTSESDTMDELCRLFAGFLHYTKILEMVAASSIHDILEHAEIGHVKLTALFSPVVLRVSELLEIAHSGEHPLQYFGQRLPDLSTFKGLRWVWMISASGKSPADPPKWTRSAACK